MIRARRCFPAARNDPRADYICRNRCRYVRLTGSTSSRPLRWMSAVSFMLRVTWPTERRFTTTDRCTCANCAGSSCGAISFSGVRMTASRACPASSRQAISVYLSVARRKSTFSTAIRRTVVPMEARIQRSGCAAALRWNCAASSLSRASVFDAGCAARSRS